MPEDKDSKKQSSKKKGMQLDSQRHGPDGETVPLDDPRAGRTLSKEWVAEDGDLEWFAPINAGSSWSDWFEAIARFGPPEEAFQFEDIEIWAQKVLVDHGFHQHSGDSFTVGEVEIEPPWEWPTEDIPRHSQLMLATLAKRSCEMIRYAAHKEDDSALTRWQIAKWSAFAIECYMTAKFKKEDEKYTLGGAKSSYGGTISSRGDPILKSQARAEAQARWLKNPGISAPQMARDLLLKKPWRDKDFKKRTIRGWIEDLLPKRKKPKI